MMRLPHFRYEAPRDVAEAARILAGEGPGAMLLGGGTDLLPNMKRRQQVPRTLVGLRRIAALRAIDNGSGLRLGGGVSLSDLVGDETVRSRYRGLWQAAVQVATPQLRNMATLAGNLCLDTRCSYYNQTYEWRKAIDFCMKKDGRTCWVATGSASCLAIASSDTAPALISLGARVRLVSAAGAREIALDALYRDDGIDYLTRRPDELVTEVLLEPGAGWKSTYWKLRRRGAFDFAVLSVAAAVRFGPDDTVEQARLVLGAVASRPVVCDDIPAFLAGKRLSDDVIAECAHMAAGRARPTANADFTARWRKRMVPQFVCYALRELRGDDVREMRKRFARQAI